jgi:catechol-2,3-dioxygenase
MAQGVDNPGDMLDVGRQIGQGTAGTVHFKDQIGFELMAKFQQAGFVIMADGGKHLHVLSF